MRSSKNARSRISAWVVPTIAAAILAACGGGGDTADDAVVRTAAVAAVSEKGGSGGDDGGHGGHHGGGHGSRVELTLLSGSAEWVSGGDARIHVRVAPGQRRQVELWNNGRRLDAANVRLTDVADGLEGVVSGLALGRNKLQARLMGSHGHDRRDQDGAGTLKLTNWPITGPMFTGPQQQPFVCTTNQSGVARQPLPDSAMPPGYKVTDAAGQVAGYSRNCSIDSFVTYLYRTTGNAWAALPAGGARPSDMQVITLPDGRTVDFIVRREVGTINRFLYSFAMLAPAAEAAAGATSPDLGLWSRKLLYWFQGGVAVGHSQGRVHSGSLNPDILRLGFAIVHSSGNNTGTHYNMNLAGETAMMTKERFIERYGVPLYTVGLGGSGGAIQQYLIAQNHPGVLDGLLPVQSYPDMVTQTIHVGDCELLEHYMDATDRTNPKWRVTKNRTLLVGMNAEEGFGRVNDALAPLKTALGYSTAPGSTECIPGWRGLTPLAMNPLYGQADNQLLWEPLADIAAIRWTHYDDLRNVYGVDASGAARVTWDNTGVQYGLASLKAMKITPAEFLHLNWHVGGWKHPSDMVQEGFPFFGTSAAEVQKVMADPSYFDPWSRRNMNLAPDAATPAPRSVGDGIAMRAAYTSGHVFSGRLEVPAIDHRQYMERELDMHNAHQSFAVRKRVQQRMGDSDNQVIWFTDTIPNTTKASQTLEALAVMDQWLMNIRANPWHGVAGNKPPMAVDACYDRNGQLMSAGEGVWSGILDTDAAGACTAAFPLYGTSRMVAGAPIEGGIYNCAKKSVARAVADGTYAPWTPNATEVAQLERIFPGGVCDYRRPDQARPRGGGHGGHGHR